MPSATQPIARSTAPFAGARALFKQFRVCGYSAHVLLAPNLTRTHCKLVHLQRVCRLHSVSHEICRATCVRAIVPPPVNHSDTMPTLNRRSFLAASAAVLAKPAVVLAARYRRRCRGCRRRRRRHRRCAPPRRRQGALRADRGGQPRRRPLRHRHQDLRRAVRSRRALDSQFRRQPAGQAGDGAGHLRGAARADRARRPAQRARLGAGKFSRRAGARASRHCRRRARQKRYRGGARAAERPRRLALDRRIRAGALHLRQRSGAGFRRGFFPPAGSRQRRLLPARLWRRCWRKLPPACRCNWRRRPSASPTARASAFSRPKATSTRARESSLLQPTCSPATRSNSRRRWTSASSTPWPI